MPCLLACPLRSTATGKSSTRDNYFHDAQLDAHFSGLLYTISTLFFADPELTPDSFSILSSAPEAIDIDDPDDDTLMAKAAGISGGVRYGPDGSR